MSITVTPEAFSYVDFDPAVIARIAEELAASIGIDRDIRVEVDETTPLARTRVEIEPGADGAIVVLADSGAFEDTRRPRSQSANATATSLGRVLYRAADRLDGGFGAAPTDRELTLSQLAAWETYCVGRLSRLGIEANEQRWRYNFRNRHSFSDAADAAFDRLWSNDGLSWDGLLKISAAAAIAEEVPA